MTTQILIEPKNPLDIRPEQLCELIESVRRLDPTLDVHLAYDDPSTLSGVTFLEVIYIWVGQEVMRALGKEIIRVAVDWAKARFGLEWSKRRPKYLTILDADGKELTSVKLDPGKDPIEELPRNPDAVVRQRPPIRD